MASPLLYVRRALVYIIVIFVGAPLILLLAYSGKYGQRLYNKFLAFIMYKQAMLHIREKSFDEMKKDLFSSMEPKKQIVEIGAGSGTNMEFYPSQCTVKCVEPNIECMTYLNQSTESVGKHLAAVDFVQGHAESLSDIISLNSVDYVVCTQVLCSVTDVEKATAEVRKVLKPGGKFYFLEHVHAPEANVFRRLYEQLANPVFKVLLGNCHLNREYLIEIESAGFSSVTFDKLEFNNQSRLGPLRWMCHGLAIK